jgi:type III pantothenate kinase
MDSRQYLITIDIGNTRTKFVIFKNDRFDLDIEDKLVIKNTEIMSEQTLITFKKKIVSFLKKFQENSEFLIYSSVNSKILNIFNSNIFNYFKDKIKILRINLPANSPFIFEYKTLKTFGNDRLASLYYLYYVGYPAIAIDAGTALTIDYINSQKKYAGGIIAPSFDMNLKALNHYTDSLPLIENKKIESIDFNNDNFIFGNSTEDCILKGSSGSVISLIVYYIEKIYKNEKNLNVVLSGGFFSEKIIYYLQDEIIKNKKLKNINFIFEKYIVNKGLKIFQSIENINKLH